MAEKPIGTIFVELDLDASRYTKGQQQLLKDAQTTSLNIEQNFKNLGIKSSAEMDLMRAKIKNSFDMIANSSKATANDRLRAEQAMNQQLSALNAKQFGEQTSIIESIKKNWIAAAAVIYGAYKTIGQVADQAEVGSKLEKQSAAFDNLSKSAGTSASKMLTELKRASRGMISETDLMAAAGKALLMSIPANEITKLMEIAGATTRMTGQTMTEAFNDITMGVARQSRMILDNLGIIVDVDQANKNYATTLGKTVEALSDVEKRQAFMNAVMKQGDDMIRRIGGGQGSLDGVSKATAEWKDAMGALSREIAEGSNPLFEALAGVLRRINLELKAGQDAAKEYGSSFESVDARIGELNAKYGDMENRKSWGYNESQDVEYRRLVKLREQYRTQGTTDFGRGNVMGRYGSFEPEYYGARRVSENEIPYDVDARWKAFEEELKKEEEASKKAAKSENESFGIVSYGAWEEQQTQLEMLRLELVKGTDAAAKFNMELYKKASEGDTRRLEKEIPFLQKEGLDERINDVVDSVSTGFDSMIELSQRTAEAMQSNFSDLFFDAMTGELKSFEDYMSAVFRSIQRALADLAGQMLTQSLFGAKATGGTAGGGGLLSGLGGWLGGLFGSGSAAGASSTGFIAAGGMSAQGNIFGPAGLVPFARGGIVDRPTVFPFARGAGIMGEAGPEAIVPLKRDSSGRLGISSSAPAANITINIAAPEGRVDRDSIGQMQTAAYTAMRRAWARNA